MRKLLVVLLTVVTIVVLAFLLPYFMGILTQKKCLELSNTVANLARIEIKTVDYQRHWFNADATFVIKVHQPIMGLNKVGDQLQEWTIKAHILHGPVVILPQTIKLAQSIVQAQVVLSPGQAELLQSHNAAALASVFLGINLDGSSLLRIDSDAIAYKDAQTSLNLRGINLKITFSAFMNHLKSQLNLANLDLVNQSLAVHLQDLAMTYAGTRNAANLFLGQRHIALKSLAIKYGNDVAVASTGLTLNTEMIDEHQTVTMRGIIGADSLLINQDNYTKNILVVEATNLNSSILAKLQRELSGLSEMRSSSIQQGMSVLKYWGLLLGQGAAFKVQQAATHTPWGEFALSGQITAVNAHALDFFSLLGDLRGDLTIRIEQPLAQYWLAKYYRPEVANSNITAEVQAKNMLNRWLQSDLITIDGKAYKVNLKYDKQFLVNDKPIMLGADGATQLLGGK